MLKVGSEVTVSIMVDFPLMGIVKGTIIFTDHNGKYGWLQSESGGLHWVEETQVIR